MDRLPTANYPASNLQPIGREEREAQIRQRACVVWFTGLSGAGKSTLAIALDRQLFLRGHQCYLLDGDNIRRGLCRDLGFSFEDRVENIRRIGEVSRLFVDAGIIVLAAFISPYRADRALVRTLIGSDLFMEVHVSTSLAVCEQRDVKGLYAKARAGLVENFTGISAPYEEPEVAALTLDTERLTPEQAIAQILDRLSATGRIRSSPA